MSWTKRVNHPSELVNIGDKIDVKILNVDTEGQQLSLGMKQTQQNPWDEVLKRYPEGSTVTGKVRNLTNYGAFIELEEGIDGLLHVSDMSWTRKPAHASEVVKKGDNVEAQVLGIDKANQRISLGLKQLAEDPWKSVEDRFKIGQKVKGSVSKVASFGAFIALEGDLDGLVHISQISEERVAKVKDVLKPGQEIEARVIRLNKAERRIGLSIKAASYSDAEFERERAALEDSSKGTDFLGGMEAAFEKAEEEYRPGEGKSKE
jgi:small subunit ribosomal protein S1